MSVEIDQTLFEGHRNVQVFAVDRVPIWDTIYYWVWCIARVLCACLFARKIINISKIYFSRFFVSFLFIHFRPAKDY